MGVVEGLLEAVVLLLRANAEDFIADIRLVEDRGEIHTGGLPVIGSFAGIEAFHMADHFIDRAEAELGHDFAQLHGDEGHEIDHMLGFAGEIFAEFRILGGDADRAGVFLADAHHQAADRDQWCGGEAVFFGAEKCGDRDIATGLELTVGFEHHAAAEVVEEEDLVGFGKAQLPWSAGIVDRRRWRGTSAAVVTGDEDHIRVGLGDASGDRADADFCDQLHIDAGARVGIFQIVDQLGEVFDRVDVVVRWWRDQSDAGRRVADLGDPWVDLGAGEFAAFAGFCALGNFDLDFVGVDQVFAGDAEAAGGDLLDRRAFAVAVWQWLEAFRVFTAFAGVGFAADAVHRDRERFVGFLRNRAVGHRAGFEALGDHFDRLHFLDRHRLAVALELHQAAQR